MAEDRFDDGDDDDELVSHERQIDASQRVTVRNSSSGHVNVHGISYGGPRISFLPLPEVPPRLKGTAR